jgi:hypothetical protein
VSGRDADLEQFLEVLARLLGRHVALGDRLGTGERLTALEQALGEADVLGLAVETADMEGSLRWLVDVVRTVARSSPSLALVLAARYTAHRAIRAAVGENAATSGATAGVVAATGRATVPGVFDPEVTVLLDADAAGGVVVAAAATSVEAAPRRTGLADAQLRAVRVVGEPSARLDRDVASAAVDDLAVLTAAAALGVAEAALRVSVDYAGQRRQFGSALLSFAGMRAILAEMQLRVSTVAALLQQALDTGATTDVLELAATAGRAAVDVAIDAIQVHGGYGYVDEYPVAGLLRDAVSLRARTSRRSSVARLADARFGPIG